MDTTAPYPTPQPQSSPQKEEAESFLRSILNKNLRVTTTDSRMFWGAFRCVDWESNLILQHTYEYRQPTPQQISAAAEAAADAAGSQTTVKVDMTSRYLGLVVVPGRHIARIEVEEFVSQLRGSQQGQGQGEAIGTGNARGTGNGIEMGNGNGHRE